MDNKAIKELKSDKIKAKNCNDIKELIKISNCLGRKYLQTQRYNDAIDEHKQELQYSLQISCRLSEAVARRALGECYSEMNEYKKALIEHNLYLSLAQSLSDRIEIQRAFATIGRTHLLHAQEVYNNNQINKEVLIEAKNSFTKALQLCDHLTELKDKELAEMRSRLYLNLGLVYEIMGHFKESMTYLHLSINLNKRFNLTEDLFRSQYSLASVYEKNNELEKSSNSFEEALKTANCLKNKIHSCDALIGNGLVLMRLRKFEESRNRFKKAYKLNSPILEDNQKVERLLKVSSIICDNFRDLSKSKDLEEKINLCDKLGDHFVELKLFDIAIDYYKKELNYSLQCNKSDTEIAKIYVSIAQTYADDLKFMEAIDYFNHELNCNRGNGIEESISLIKIAEMKEYLENEELNEDIIQTYETALERIGTLDTNLLTDYLQRYLAFLESRRLNSDKVLQLKERIKILNSHKTTSIERVDHEEEEELDIYDAYDLNDISECSTDSDEEEGLSNAKTKRMGKSLKKNQLGETPLHRACIEGKVKRVERLLVDKHPVNVRDYCGWTPLHEAVNNGHKQIVELLLKSGANINDNEGVKTDGITPLHDACSNGHFDIIRLLLKNGAKVTVLNNSNETALDSLRDWKRRCSEEKCLNDNDLQDFKLIEKQLEEMLNREGFVRKNIPTLNALIRKPKVYIPVLRGRNSSESSDDSLEIPINRLKNNRMSASNSKNKSNDEIIDFDDPRVARREYCSSISNLRRNNDTNESLDVRPKPKAIPALLDQRKVVNDDQWLIKDMNDTRKRSCLDAYEAFNKRTKTNDSNLSHRTRKPKLRSTHFRTETLNSDQLVSNDSNEEFSSDNESVSNNECIVEPIVDKNERNIEINNKNSETNVNINSRTYVKSIQLRVSVGDNENTLLIIPILNRSSNCLWLNKEVVKRYFAKFGIKPVISLKTTDGALISDEDCILDVITENELKVLAIIESWILDPLDVRYKDICNSCGVQPLDDIIKELQMTQINGCLKLSDVNLPIDQIKTIFRALERQNNLIEIDISSSNIIIDGAIHFFRCLTLLPSLQILNLKCTSMGLQNMEQLIIKCCPHLLDLNMSFNSFGDEFCEALIKVVKHFSKLNVLDLSATDLTNHLFNSNEFNDCIKNSNLSSIVLDYNTIDSELIQRFRKL